VSRFTPGPWQPAPGSSQQQEEEVEVDALQARQQQQQQQQQQQRSLLKRRPEVPQPPQDRCLQLLAAARRSSTQGRKSCSLQAQPSLSPWAGRQRALLPAVLVAAGLQLWLSWRCPCQRLQ